jgi:UDP-GlcNAc:undecaprenyl-phosphate GlcNAc-1-phosphate transferase
VGVSFAISLLATSVSKRVAVRLNWLDRPGRHKAHAQPTPMLGGSAIFLTVIGLGLLGLAIGRLWLGQTPAWVGESLGRHVAGVVSRTPQALGILLGAMALHIAGLIDDRRALGPWRKLFIQAGVATGVVFFCDVRVLTFAGSAVSIVATILWLVAITNAFNFLDNMDGLAAGVGAIVAAALMGAALGAGQLLVPAAAALLLGALLGFLVHNFPPASVFMGDAGSMVIGYLLAVTSCLTTYAPPATDETLRVLYAVCAPVLLMGVPLYDALSVVWIRLREGRNPMIGDWRHFSHRLLRRGMSPRTAALTIYLCAAGTAVAASLLPHQTRLLPAVMIVVQALCILLIIALLERTEK